MIRILMFLSDTRNLLTNQDSEYKNLKDIIQRSNYRNKIELRYITSTTIDDIIDEINSFKPHIVHFSSHGTEDGELEIFDTDGNYCKDLNAKQLKTILNSSKSIKFLFLNFCYSKAFAQNILEEDIVILAIDGEINNQDALKLSNRFYESLLSDLTVKEAFKQSKIALSGIKSPISLFGSDTNIKLDNITSLRKIEVKKFVDELIREMLREQIILFLSQNFTDVEIYNRFILDKLKKLQDVEIYNFEIDEEFASKEDFLYELKEQLGIGGDLKKFFDFKRWLEVRVENSDKKIIFIVKEFDKGDIEYTYKLATIIRNLKEYRNFFSIIVGRRKLAKLRYENGELSPLNTAKEKFLPSFNLNSSHLNLALHGVDGALKSSEKARICSYLRDNLGRFDAWSNDRVLNTLFWNNLITEEDGNFVWSSEKVKEEIREYFRC